MARGGTSTCRRPGLPGQGPARQGRHFKQKPGADGPAAGPGGPCQGLAWGPQGSGEGGPGHPGSPGHRQRLSGGNATPGPSARPLRPPSPSASLCLAGQAAHVPRLSQRVPHRPWFGCPWGLWGASGCLGGQTREGRQGEGVSEAVSPKGQRVRERTAGAPGRGCRSCSDRPDRGHSPRLTSVTLPLRVRDTQDPPRLCAYRRDTRPEAAVLTVTVTTHLGEGTGQASGRWAPAPGVTVLPASV